MTALKAADQRFLLGLFFHSFLLHQQPSSITLVHPFTLRYTCFVLYLGCLHIFLPLFHFLLTSLFFLHPLLPSPSTPRLLSHRSLHPPPPISWFPQLPVMGRLRWLREAEMDEVSAKTTTQRHPQSAARTANIPPSRQVRPVLVTAIHCSPFA